MLRTTLLPLLSLSLAAQGQAPVITVEQPHFSFGRIGPDKKLSHTYLVKNTGDAVLAITKVNPTCGCTGAVLGKGTLAPGESTEVEITFNPAGMHSLVHKSLTVDSNDPKTPKLSLTFNAEVIWEIETSSRFFSFMDLARGEKRHDELRLKSGNGQPVEVKEVKAAGAPYYTFGTRMDGHDAIVDVTLDAAMLPADPDPRGTDTITVLTSSKTMPTITFAVMWGLKAALEILPNRISWTEAAGKELRQKLTLLSSQGRVFKILATKSSNPHLHLEGKLGASAVQHEFTAVLDGNIEKGRFYEEMALTTDDPDQPVVKVMVSALIR